MKMNMFGTFLVSIALALVSVDAATTAYPACSSHKHVTGDFESFIKYSPYYVYRSTHPLFSCSKVVYIRPFGQYTGTGILIKGDSSFIFWLNQLNSTTWDAVQCSNGDRDFVNGVYKNLDSDGASFCFIVCADDGIGYKELTCMGTNRKHEAEIQKFLDTNLKGVPGIINTQQDCKESRYCNLSNK